MAMNFFKDKLIPTFGSVEGPSVSISVRRSQVSFSKDAVETMKLQAGKSFIEIGYDDEAKEMAFKVQTKAADNRAEVQNLHVQATNVDVPVIYIGSYLKEIPEISRKSSVRYQLHTSEDGYFFISLNEGKEKTKPQPRQKKVS